MVVIYYYSFVSLYQIYNFIFVLNLPEKILLRRSFAFDARLQFWKICAYFYFEFFSQSYISYTVVNYCTSIVYEQFSHQYDDL